MNLPDRSTKAILPIANEKGFAFYTLKDLQMAREADYGFMVWNGTSKGTLNNIRNLLINGKKVLVFLSSDQSFHNVRKAEDLYANQRQSLLPFGGNPLTLNNPLFSRAYRQARERLL